MAMLQIDGIGDVEVDNAFLKLPPEQQAVEVEHIAAAVKGRKGVEVSGSKRGGAPLATLRAQYPEYSDLSDAELSDRVYQKFYSDMPRAEFDAKIGSSGPMQSEEDIFLEGVNKSQPAPDSLTKRSSMLPVSRNDAGELVPSVPGIVEGPKNTIIDILEGRRTSDQITPREYLELGALLAGAPAGGAAGTGAGVARAVAEKLAPEAAGASRRGLGKVDDFLFGQTKAETKAAAQPATGPNVATGTTPEMKAAATGLYKQAEEAGVVLRPQTTRALADDIFTTASKEGLDPTLHPRTTAAIKRINEVADEPLAFQSLETLRKVANAAGKGLDKDEGRLAGIVKDKIDDFMRGLSDKDVYTGIEGDAAKASEFIFKARDLWSRVAKLETVEGLVDRAATSAPNFSASGMENALRTEFRALAKNQRQMRTFTKDEQAAIKRVARGTFGGNIARNLGRFAPTGPVSSASTAVLGTTLGGPVATGAAFAVAFGARKLATILTQRNIKALETIIRGGAETESATEALTLARGTLKKLSQAAPTAGRAKAAEGERK